uniref:Uncharacterized protein n=1 Tax=Eptatretus burgeri TaxID=7764 RepID=A0A8C4Q376_EPTBU
MEAPPAYSDLGRHILDLFNLGCDPGLIRLDCKSKTRDAVELGYSSVFGLESRRFTGNVSVGRYLPVRDMNVTGRWATDGALGARVDFYRLVRGVDLTFDAAFYPTTGNKPASARASVTRPSLRVEAEANFEEVGTTATFSTVYRTGHWLMGAWTQLGGPSGVDAQWFGSAGYEVGHRRLMVTIEGGRFLKLLMSQPFGPLDWGAHSTLSATGTFNGFLGLAFSHVLSPGVKLTLCNSFNLNTLNSGGHAVGIGLEFES